MPSPTCQPSRLVELETLKLRPSTASGPISVPATPRSYADTVSLPALVNFRLEPHVVLPSGGAPESSRSPFSSTSDAAQAACAACAAGERENNAIVAATAAPNLPQR